MLTEPTTNLEKVVPEAHDFLPLLGTDHVELIVGNAKQSAYYYMAAWGFQPLAFKGLETGSKDSVSYVLRQDRITLVLTTPRSFRAVTVLTMSSVATAMCCTPAPW